LIQSSPDSRLPLYRVASPDRGPGCLSPAAARRLQPSRPTASPPRAAGPAFVARVACRPRRPSRPQPGAGSCVGSSVCVCRRRQDG